VTHPSFVRMSGIGPGRSSKVGRSRAMAVNPGRARTAAAAADRIGRPRRPTRSRAGRDRHWRRRVESAFPRCSCESRVATTVPIRSPCSFTGLSVELSSISRAHPVNPDKSSRVSAVFPARTRRGRTGRPTPFRQFRRSAHTLSRLLGYPASRSH
jgi:hypothetical protein